MSRLNLKLEARKYIDVIGTVFFHKRAEKIKALQVQIAAKKENNV